MLRFALNLKWQQHITNEQLYGNLPKASMKIRERRMRLSGHCLRHTEDMVSRLILWELRTGDSRRGRRILTYIDNLKADTGLDTSQDISTAMNNRDVWRHYIKLARGNTRPK